MIIGSGLLAKAFVPEYSLRDDVCIFAAGVSNSGCTDHREFKRERIRLEDALSVACNADVFVYFSTCSINDPESRDTPYVQHKLAMEGLVSTHPGHLILRLPQVAGVTPNPHTILNYLYAKIARSESFSLWKYAKRNIIDVDDVTAVSRQLIGDRKVRGAMFNVANPVSYPVADIVRAMEKVTGKRAIYDMVERGTDYPVDICAVRPVMDRAQVNFGDNYLEKVIGKYYGRTP